MKKYLIYSIGFLLFFSSFLAATTFAQTNEVTPVIAPTGTPVIGSYTGNCDPSKDENCYQFLEALPTSEGDLTSVNTGADKKKGTGLGEFIMFAFEIGVGIAGVLGVVMLTIYGFQYAANDKNIANFEVLKEKITKVMLGLLLLLGIFVILNTINPDLLILEPEINIAELKVESIETISDTDYQTITGTRVLSPTEYDAMAKDVAKTVGVDYCALKVILERESKGKPGAIGYDENVGSASIPSRVAFINSKIKYSGETFSSSSELITKKDFRNDSKFDASKSDLGLDWRFSKGVGLTQITFFPNGYFSGAYKNNPPSWSLRKNIITRELYPGGPVYTVKQMLDAKTNIEAGAKLYKYSYESCGNSVYGAWVKYASGSCNSSNSFAKKEAATRTLLFNGCKKTNP